MRVFQRLWHDEAGFVVSTELVLIATILVIGVVVGLNAVRNSVTNELADVGKAVDNLNQSLVVEGVQGHAAAISGWSFVDLGDFCNTSPNDAADNTAVCIFQDIAAVAEGGAQTQPQ